MKIFLISILYGAFVSSAMGQSREEILSRQDFYSGQSYSLIDWERLDTVQWLDLAEWKDDIALKDREPNWRRNLRERGLAEQVGLGLECVGRCPVYRGDGESNLRLRSSIMEGDEITTEKDSYAWLFLKDGTMVRISPNSSLSLREINISDETIFFHARLNYGHISWMSRLAQPLKSNNLRETDALFLPLNYFEANLFFEPKVENPNSFYQKIDDVKLVEMQYKRLNDLIEKNNEWAKGKNTTLFLVMQNASLLVENPMLEAIMLPGTESYLKNRTAESYGHENERETSTELSLRGYDNTQTQSLELGTWYKIDTRGREVSTISDDQMFKPLEYLTSRIPTILYARELFFADLSSFVFDKSLDRLALASKHGYRKWIGSVNSGEIQARIKFMTEYARRSETTLLVETDKFNRQMTERGEGLAIMTWSDEFYRRAMDAYVLQPTRFDFSGEQGEILNSTTNPFWKIINARKNL